MKLLQCKYSSKSSRVIASGKLTHEIYFSRTLEERIVVDMERIFEIFSYYRLSHLFISVKFMQPDAVGN